MPFFLETSPEFRHAYGKFCGKNASFRRMVDLKIQQIRTGADFKPDHYKPLRGELAGMRRVHVSSFVLFFRVFEETKTVRIMNLKHHNNAYK